MTDNHLLLYRLADLMLQHEQHTLPVDLLFDDEQIGDFVKSIQIDSPYQQMLFEGVLTESVKDEKLYVSFTVEGYFHYVLGEVLWNYNLNKPLTYLIDLLRKNSTKGLKAGVRQFLEKEIINGELSTLLYFIDNGVNPSEYCSVPLSNAFLQYYNKENVRFNDTNDENIDSLLKRILEDQSENDFNVIFDAISYLEIKQRNKCLLHLHESVFRLKFNRNIDFLKILLKGLPYLSEDSKRLTLEKIGKEVLYFKTTDIYPELLFELGSEYIRLGEYVIAIKYLEQSLKIFDSKKGDFEDRKEKLYCNIGSAYWYLSAKDETKYYYQQSHEICLKLYGYYHPITAISYHNLALVKVLDENYKESIILFEKALKIELQQYGDAHSSTARSYSSLGSAYMKLGDMNRAQLLFEKSLKIDSAIFHSMHPNLALDLDDLGDIYFERGNYKNAKINYERAKSIFIFNYGFEFPHAILLEEKLKKLNDL